MTSELYFDTVGDARLYAAYLENPGKICVGPAGNAVLFPQEWADDEILEWTVNAFLEGDID